MKRAFTLTEVAVATVIILVVLSAFTIALVSFFRGSRQLELQQGAAVLARLEIADMEKTGSLPEEGTSTRSDVFMGDEFTVETSVLYTSENIAEVTVDVWSGDSVSAGYSRRFYDDFNR